MKFRLRAQHFDPDDRLLEIGTIVATEPSELNQGEILWRNEPTPDMEPLDDKAKKLLADLYEFDKLNQRFIRRRGRRE